MTPSSFEYFSPSTLEEACRLLESHPGEARVLAGGQSLIPLLKMRFTTLSYLVDISRIPGLSEIREENGTLHIGPMVRVAELNDAPSVRQYHAIADAARIIADPLVRNMGTVGGNLSHGDPSNDLPAVMIAMNAVFTVTSTVVSRRINARDFYLDTFTTALKEGEILSSISVPGHSGSAYLKQKRSAGDFSVAGVAVALDMDGRLCRWCGIGLTSVGPVPLSAAKAEEMLRGNELNASLIERAASEASMEARPSSDFYGTAEYKRYVVKKLTKEAIELAIRRAGGQ
jgi:carbon-monoxide dehydrogenase medium subunit